MHSLRSAPAVVKIDDDDEVEVVSMIVPADK